MKNASLILATCLSIASFPAYSAGEGSQPKKTKTTEECEEGQIWNEEKEECVDAEESNNLTDDIIYENAREFAYFGQLDHAMRLLNLAKNQNDPRILTYKGFVSRKSGKTDASFAYYKQALGIDPKYDLARSYYGQALLKDNRQSEAAQQLALIAVNGGTETWAYTSLANSFGKAISGHGTVY